MIEHAWSSTADRSSTSGRAGRPRLLRAALTASLVALLAAGPVPVASATPAPVPAAAAADTNVGAAGQDFATTTFGDAWNYQESDDILLDDGPAVGLTSSSVSGGLLRGTSGPASYVSPLWAGYPGAVLLGRDGALPQNRLDASRYRTVAFQAWASRDVPAGLFWFDCATGVSNTCGGGRSLNLLAGWHTYVLNPGASVFDGWPLAWGGQLTGLRLALSPGSGGAQFAVDWMRVVQPGSGASVTWTNSRGGSGELLWDGDGTDGNNTGDQSNWGSLGSVSGRSGSADLAVLPPGIFRIGVRTSAGVEWNTTVGLTAPLPEVLTPNEVGDQDWATTVRGNPWDLSGPDDVTEVNDANAVSYAGGQLSATNTGGDPFVWLAMGGRTIDTRVYRHLTVTSSYDGPFNLADGAGGGTMARVMWSNPSRPGAGQSNDLVTYSGRRTISVDLGMRDADLLEPDAPNFGYTSNPVATGLRWDPNEDIASRRWHLDDVQLRSDFATTGTFPITWRDNAYAAGGTATLVADTDRTGCNGTTVAGGVPVQAGTNTTTWNTAGVPGGRYWLCLTIRRGNSVTSGYAGGPLVVGANPAAPPAGTRNPVGSYDSGTLSGADYTVSGWSFDPDAPNEAMSVDVHDVRPDGSRTITRLSTGGSRPDVAAAFGGSGSRSGFSASVKLAGAGRHDVCVFGINVGAGTTNPLYGCRPVDVPRPVGSVDGVVNAAPGTVTVSGWTADPVAPGTPMTVDVYVNGPAGQRGYGGNRAADPRPDVQRVLGWPSANSGYSVTVPTQGTGAHTVCVFGIDVNPPRSNPLLGCRTVQVRDAFGALDVLSVSGGQAVVEGWAINPNQPGTATEVHVYDYGPSAVRGYSGFRADRQRPDLAVFGLGTAHGYRAAVPVSGAGKHTFCAFGITTGGGAGNALLGCRDVQLG